MGVIQVLLVATENAYEKEYAESGQEDGTQLKYDLYSRLSSFVVNRVNDDGAEEVKECLGCRAFEEAKIEFHFRVIFPC